MSLSKVRLSGESLRPCLLEIKHKFSGKLAIRQYMSFGKRRAPVNEFSKGDLLYSYFVDRQKYKVKSRLFS